MDAATEMKTKDLYLNEFKKDGVFVFKGMMSLEAIKILTSEVDKIRAVVLEKIVSMERPLRPYSDISERYLGRFDYRCGFTAEVFNQIAEPIIHIVKHLSPNIDFRYYWGAIPSLGGSGATDLHRDVYPILNTAEGENLGPLDINFPPYYFTVLIPLVEITRENGPTEFIKGSYCEQMVDKTTAEIYAPLSSPGDVIIFDGRTLHRGSPNSTKEERVIAYITFVANWYHDQTFVINDYLFPELSMKGR